MGNEGCIEHALFCLQWAFFVMEALKTVKKPLNFPKNGNFLKKGIPKFFACDGLFFVVEALKTVKKP